MIFLKSIVKLHEVSNEKYPFSLPVLENFKELNFLKPVTIFCGDNGSGKSTFLEIIGLCAGSIRISNKPMKEDREFENLSYAAKYFKLSWTLKNKKGFFLRSEDFIEYVKNFDKTKESMSESLKEVESEYKGRSQFSKNLARMPYCNSLYAMNNMYNGDLNEKSHGESYLEFFRSRIKPSGLYILDEPEAPLSPLNQIGFLAAINEMVKQNCQFIIATHSPILMAYKDAQIYEMSGNKINSVKYSDIESVRFLRSFLNNPDKYLRYI